MDFQRFMGFMKRKNMKFKVHQIYGVTHYCILFLEWGHIYVMANEYVCIASKVNNLTAERLITLRP